MTKLIQLALAALATTLLLGAGCASDVDEPIAPEGSSELATHADIEALQSSSPEQSELVGCSNAQIRFFQSECRLYWCPSGSNGIHWCDQQPATGQMFAQCDCVSGTDPTIWAWI